ncbi:hypothetical protein AURDEDRAFT_168986 [Auricularia subglabra TFB-10046 SS5]|nr:hypothetical protein AURDEDRAFT_168986 [Auricularia subglabra TFB-10046 SS5]
MVRHAHASRLRSHPDVLPVLAPPGDDHRTQHWAMDLPHEIQLRIFEFLRACHLQDDCIPPFICHDSHNLYTSTLICRGWHACAVEALYNSILLRSVACTAQFARTLRTRPNVALLVRRITIQEDLQDSARQLQARPSWWNVLQHLPTHAHWQRHASERDRAFILGSCTRATGLKCYADGPWDRCKRAVVCRFESVANLELCGSGLGKFRDAKTPLSSLPAFTELRTLTLRSFSLVILPTDSTGTQLAPVPHLRRLNLRKCSISVEYIHFLLRLFPNVTSIRIEFCVLLDKRGHFDRSRILDIAGLLAPVSSELHTLAVNFSKVYSVQLTTWEFTALRSLELNWDPARTPLLELPPNLETLRLVTWYEPPAHSLRADHPTTDSNLEDILRDQHLRELLGRVGEVKRVIPSWKLSAPTFRRLEIMHWRMLGSGLHAWGVVSFLFRPWCALWGLDLDVSVAVRT